MTDNPRLVRAAWGINAFLGKVGKFSRKRWYIYLIVGLLVVVAAAVYFARPYLGTNKELIDAMQKQILDEVARERAKSEARIKELESEMFELGEQIRFIDQEIEASVQEREATHDAINKARNIRELNAILRKGRRSPGSYENSTSDRSPRGVDSNPFD